MTEYTSIPHSELKNAIPTLCTEVFNCNTKKFLYATTTRAYRSNKKVVPRDKTKGLCFDLSLLIKSFTYIIDNIYVTFNDGVYRQIIGIPMGTDCAPLLANLFLYHYENEWIKRLELESKNEILRHVKNNYRYIDDLLSLNDNNKFLQYLADIYPAQMEISKTNDSSNSANYLDMKISIKDGKFIVMRYDKREDFNFKVINFPHFNTNSPTNAKLGVMIGQMLRYLEINSNVENFIKDCRELKNKFISQTFNY